MGRVFEASNVYKVNGTNQYLAIIEAFGYDETLALDPCHLRYVFQGADPNANTGGDYNEIPWQLGVLTQVD